MNKTDKILSLLDLTLQFGEADKWVKYLIGQMVPHAMEKIKFNKREMGWVGRVTFLNKVARCMFRLFLHWKSWRKVETIGIYILKSINGSYRGFSTQVMLKIERSPVHLEKFICIWFCFKSRLWKQRDLRRFPNWSSLEYRVVCQLVHSREISVPNT